MIEGKREKKNTHKTSKGYEPDFVHVGITYPPQKYPMNRNAIIDLSILIALLAGCISNHWTTKVLKISFPF